MIKEQILCSIRGCLDEKGVVEDAIAMAPYLSDRRGDFSAVTQMVVRPSSTHEVSNIVKICAAVDVGIVPQSGNTGLVGGSIPDGSGNQILLSLDRMNRVRDMDVLNQTMTVDAGCILADVQAAADETGLLFPLSLAAEGSCRIGGNIGTNAGGTQVLRYGNTRDLVLGLEVVLPNGEVWDGLRRLRKDNTGYNLKQLFVGSEGTLGIITAAVLKLYPKPRQAVTVFAAVVSPLAANEFLSCCRQECGDTVTTFEYMHRHCLDIVLDKIPGTRDPLGARYEHYLLIQVDSPQNGNGLRESLEFALEKGFEAGQVEDAVVSTNIEQSRELWRIRESIPEAAKINGSGIRHDVSVPVSEVATFLREGQRIVRHYLPNAYLIPFGHYGDGNIHYNMLKPPEMEIQDFRALEHELRQDIYHLVTKLGGSFSAEHGIGQLKRQDLVRFRSDVELGIMHQIKAALDPKNIMNPGKVL